MNGRILPWLGDHHDEAQRLLPWYVTGTLEDAERAKVEAHLIVCAECRAELLAEQGLRAQIAAAPVDLDQGWERLRARAAHEPRRSWGWRATTGWVQAAARGVGGDLTFAAPWLRWTLAAQFALILTAGALVLSRTPQVQYHALGAAPAGRPGDVVVVFRPEAREQALRETLEANHARVVDGPTSTDAYLIYVPPAERAQTLNRLRANAAVTLAEPVDTGAPP